ncbi:site-specific DNA-methyltransferase [Empedobacter falsenii]|uniref:DNA methyltransferase n=1 Tax=Empedobacter falsenii TaxID=343874 RepID=UPI00257697D8|nr:DNA methyltransferase [Empedobacter falsenii]MDM1061806.1 site-specific DNA-methyltransferase [Empedobacter falsenii]
MSNYNKLQDVLKEIFEMDKADLDFGIYRIMNQKRDQVMDFIDRKLPKDIKDILAQTQSKDSVSIQAEIDQLGKSLDDAGVARESAPKYIALKAQLENAIDTNALEQEVFSHLANFFKRYYKDGDFISLRRYKKDVYAIPYEGEEVKLHWANHDQYYIKTSEYLKNYSFKLKDGKSVHFQLKEASTEQNNNKAQGDQERRFAIYEEQPVEVIDGQLYINFTYEPYKKTVKQDDLAKHAFEVLQKSVPGEFALAFDKAPTEKDKNRTLLQKHLNDFISRNSFDYFIHKDLGGFLRRELDFYIKNEVLYIDDINTENPAYFTAQLSKIKALKTVAAKIITFLAQIEDFQKKLWLKKKFVISTNYCITLDRIPEKYYPEIVANQAQLDEWKELFDVVIPSTEAEALEALRNEPYLVLDTKHFSEEFKDKLLAEFDNLDEETNGLLINSENFQALNYLSNKYYNKIQSIYIDPPYNTVHSKILYKNQFEHSSWLSLMNNSISTIKPFFTEDFSFGLAIDDYEYVRLGMLMQNHFSSYDVDDIIINHHPQGSGGRLSRTHEHFIIASASDSPQYLLEGTDTVYEERSFMRSGTAENNYRYGRWRSFYALLFDEVKNEIVGVEEPPVLNSNYPLEKTDLGFTRIYPINSSGEERVWRSSFETGKKRVENGEIFITKNGAIKQKIIHENKAEVVFSNWIGAEYNAGTQGSNVLTNLGIDFDYPKSVKTMERIVELQSFGKSDNIVLDYFAGSGTTVHAVINLNRYKNRQRKYIAIDVGSYFEDVILNRSKKVIYTDNWKNGKPQDKVGISQLFKYQVLESYEDALNNLQLPNKTNEALLNFEEQAQEEYILNYMLDVETQDHLFNIQMFRNPFNYQLKVTENNELVPTKVDLVETFNYLIGLYVERVQRVGDIKFVEGKTREGIKTLVIWRNLETTTNEETAQRFRKIYDSVRSSEFDQIYINGDHHFDNMRTGEDTFKVKLIEETFFKQMFNISEL